MEIPIQILLFYHKINLPVNIEIYISSPDKDQILKLILSCMLKNGNSSADKDKTIINY